MDQMDDEFNSTKQNDDLDEMVDPTMFLERTADEGDEPLMVGVEMISTEKKKKTCKSMIYCCKFPGCSEL